MGKSNSILAAAFTIFGIIIGAGLNHYFTSQREMNSDLFSARLDAYVTFMNGQALRTKANTVDEQEKANRQITKAKYALAMLSSQEVLQAMVDYWKKEPAYSYEECADSALRVTDANIYQEIRKEMIQAEKSTIDVAVLVPFLWGCTVSSM